MSEQFLVFRLNSVKYASGTLGIIPLGSYTSREIAEDSAREHARANPDCTIYVAEAYCQFTATVTEPEKSYLPGGAS